MPAFRLLNQFPVYLDNSGRPAAGGYLLFFDSGTSDPKAVYADKALTQSNGARVNLDSAGRTEVDVWGDGAYRVRLYDALDTLIQEADGVELAGNSGTSIPDMVDGWFLTNNGGLLLWAPVREVPDPTGQSGKVLGTDGTNLNWQAPAEAPEAPGVAVTPDSFLAGGSTTDKFFVQWGSAEAPASGSNTTTKTVPFPVSFSGAPKVFVMATSRSQPGGPVVPELTSAPSASQFTVSFDVAEGNVGGANIVSPVPFDWIAFGLKATEAP